MESSSWSMLIVVAIGVVVLLIVLYRLVRVMRGRGGCGCGTSSCPGVVSGPGLGAHGSTKAHKDEVELRVTGMHCGNCEQIVIRALGEVKGVRSVRASHAAGAVWVRTDGRQETLEAVRARLAEVGFPVVAQ